MPTPLPGPLARRPLLVVALLAATLFALLPAVASAQPQPPLLYWGSNDTVTIGGQPWDGSTIEVIDEAGDVVAVVQREADGWHVRIPNDVAAFRFRASNGGVSELYSPAQGVGRENVELTIGSPPGAEPVRQVSLLPGFNFVLWTGSAQPVVDALATFPDTSQLSAVFEFDAIQQKWLAYRPGRPAFLQKIAELRPGTAYFLLVGDAMTWNMPTTGDLAGARPIATGFTAVGWLGPDGTPQDVLDAIADPAAVTAFFRYNRATGKYDSYRPHLPPIARGSIRAIELFDVLFVQATSPTRITQ